MQRARLRAGSTTRWLRLSRCTWCNCMSYTDNDILRSSSFMSLEFMMNIQGYSRVAWRISLFTLRRSFGTSLTRLDNAIRGTTDHVSFFLPHGDLGINSRLLMIEATLCAPYSSLLSTRIKPPSTYIAVRGKGYAVRMVPERGGGR